MTLLFSLLRAALVGLAFAVLGTADARAQAKTTAQTPAFSVEATSLQTSEGGNGWRYLTAVVHFHNRAKRPLVLGVDASKSGASDEKGNRYAITTVRGIGTVAGSTVDPSFALPAEGDGDALVEMRWRGARNVEFGVVFDLSLAVRELEPRDGGQVRLGTESVVELTGLRTDFAAAPKGGPALSERIVNAGPFAAQIVRSKGGASANRRWQTMDLTVRLTNTSDKPLTLGYESGSSMGTDNTGHRWLYGVAGTHDTSFSGIGLVTGAQADAQLTLAPGESKEVRFTVQRALGRDEAGARLVWSVALQRLETLPSGQIRKLRQYTLTFPNLPLGP